MENDTSKNNYNLYIVITNIGLNHVRNIYCITYIDGKEYNLLNNKQSINFKIKITNDASNDGGYKLLLDSYFVDNEQLLTKIIN